MEHYKHLILKGLINGGGSSSESYVYRLLTADFKKGNESVSRMWRYLDKPLQAELIEIFHDVCGVDLKGKLHNEIISLLIDYIANKSGRDEFFYVFDKSSIERMSDYEYNDSINCLISTNKEILLNRE